MTDSKNSKPLQEPAFAEELETVEIIELDDVELDDVAGGSNGNCNCGKQSSLAMA